MPRNTSSPGNRRDLGQYYTPQTVARAMVRASLGFHHMQNVSVDRNHWNDRLPTVLDPACGDGVFLLEAFDHLQSRLSPCRLSPPRDSADDRAFATSPSNGFNSKGLDASIKLQLVRDHLFGVDVDRRAIDALRQTFRARIAPEADQEEGVHRVLESNLRVGNALTGPSFGEASVSHSSSPDAIDWNAAFPRVRELGGFDVIVGNPPYRRELHAKELFAQIAATPLGHKWRQARMDLWYYFLHRSLDLLQPGGVLSFIVNSYWTASSGASRLIQRLEQETVLDEIVLLGKAPIFSAVSGQHLIFQLRKAPSNGVPVALPHCRITDVSGAANDDADVPGNNDRFPPNTSHSPDWQPLASCLFDLMDRPTPAVATGFQWAQYDLAHDQMFQHGRLLLGRPDPLVAKLQGFRRLDEDFEVRQGMAENPPSISPRHQREFGRQFRAGEGVFVLAPDEGRKLALSAEEARFLRPYFATSALGRYRLPEHPTHHVLYLTRHTAPSLEGYDQIERHLSRFRVLLERRRETQRGTVRWWQLHWPREERIFSEPSILSVQMVREPQFVYAPGPTYVGFSVNIVLPRDPDGIPLAALAGMLNSKMAARWFAAFAKRRGVHLEINGNVLRRFPLPKRNPPLESELSVLVSRRQSVEHSVFSSGPCTPRAKLDRRIDELVERLYDSP